MRLLGEKEKKMNRRADGSVCVCVCGCERERGVREHYFYHDVCLFVCLILKVNSVLISTFNVQAGNPGHIPQLPPA